MTCNKCGMRDRVVGQRWCKECLAEDKRLRRAGNARGERVGNGEQSVGNTPPCPECVALLARVEVLEADNADLKRRLAKGSVPGPAVLLNHDLGPVGAARGACGHGQFCQALACRAAR